jgi:hypothetical protein
MEYNRMNLQSLIDAQVHLTNLRELLQTMQIKGYSHTKAGYDDVNTQFINTTIKNIQVLEQQFEIAMNTEDVQLILYVIFSIDSFNRYFAEVDLDWSNDWHNSLTYDQLQSDVQNLLYEDRIQDNIEELKLYLENKRHS